MRRILWLSGFVLGVIGLAAGIGNDLVISAPSSAAATQQVEGNGVTVIATLLTEQPESTAIKLTLGLSGLAVIWNLAFDKLSSGSPRWPPRPRQSSWSRRTWPV